MNSLKGKHILIVVENLPVPFDRRVWQEANTLRDNGAKVSIICPKMKGYTKKYEKINDIEIYRHPLPFEASGAFGYLLEYSTALFWEFVLSFRIYLKKRFQVIHGCNPPDLIFIVSLLFKLFGVKYVFDHHDINPELFIAKYDKKGFFYRLMLILEKLTFKTADFSIATNESYKNIAIERGGMNPDKVQIVRSGPKLDRLKILDPIEKYKKSKRILLGYVGVIGEQEGIDLLLDAMKLIVEKRGDLHLAIVGGGTYLEELKKYCSELGLDEYVDFYGRVEDKLLVEILNTADICVNPDKPTEMNNLSTMNKIMEYMSLKKPIVQFDLKEGRFSAQEASLYANSTKEFADQLEFLADNKDRRDFMGDFGYNRVINELSWDHESLKLIDFYKKVLKIN